MKYDVITIGGATEDLAFHTDEGVIIDNKQDILRQKLVAFEYGAKVKVTKATSTFGGGAANAAVSLSRLGFKTAAFVAIGDDERGVRIVNNLKKEKVKTELVQTCKNELSGLSPVIVLTDNEHVSFSIRGANTKLKISNPDKSKLKNTKWFYLTSLSGDKKDWLANLNNIFSISNVKIAWNPGHLQLDEGKPVLGKFLKKTELIIVNLDEARELVISDEGYSSKGPDFFDDVEELLRIIKGWGPKIVVITLGKEGAVAFDGNKIYKIGASIDKHNINTVGVGDSFGSSLVAGLELYQGDILKAMNLGKKNASSVVTKEGAQTGLIYKKNIN